LHAAFSDAAARELPLQEEAGVVMPVFENSVLSAVEQGIVLNNATIWPLLRNNRVQPADPTTPPVLDQSKALQR